MQSLISQITNLFATQSLNSLDNSELYQYSPVSSEFGGLLESFTGENYAANIAAQDGNPLHTSSYIPISFQLTQFAVTAIPSGIEGAVEYSGQISSTHLKGDLDSLTNAFNSNVNSLNQELNDLTNSTKLIPTVSQNFDGEQHVLVSVTSAQPENRSNLFQGVNNVADDPFVTTQLSTRNRQEINPQVENVVRNAFVSNTHESDDVENVIQRNAVNLINSKIVTNNPGSNIDDVTKDNNVTNNVTTSGIGNNKLPDQNLSSYSVTSRDEKIADFSTTSTQLSGAKAVGAAGLSVEESKVSLIRESGNDKVATTNDNVEVRYLANSNNTEAVELYTDNELKKQLVTDSLPTSKDEIIAAKQIYNQVQQDEVRRLDNNVREEVRNIRSSSFDIDNFSDNISRRAIRNDLGIDLTTATKNQDIIQDVKILAQYKCSNR